jgi:hypothetical protein
VFEHAYCLGIGAHKQVEIVWLGFQQGNCKLNFSETYNSSLASQTVCDMVPHPILVNAVGQQLMHYIL